MKENKIKNRCLECEYFYVTGTVAKDEIVPGGAFSFGECRRMSPICLSLVMLKFNKKLKDATWPIVIDTMLCGEFKHK